MAENYTDGLIFTKNLDEKGTPFTPKLVEVAKVSENGKVQCKQNIYKKNGVRIISPDGLRRVNKVEQLLSSTNAYFIYEDRGEVLFSDDLIGQVVAFEYYGTGNPNIGDCRVFTTVDNKGNITETLGDIIREGRDIIESLRILGNGAIIFNKLEEVVANAEVLNSALGIKITVGQQVSERLEADINTGKALDTTLKATINTGNSTNTTLNNTIASANATKTEVVNTINTTKTEAVNTINTTVTNANNSVNATISKANTANTTLNATINKANESNTTLNATITHGEQVLGELNTQVTELETSDNKVFQINPADWVLNASTNRYEKVITHGMGKTSLIFEYQTVKNGKKCSYFMDYEIQDENSIKFITESADTVYVNISARYSTNLRFEESQIEVDKMVDGSNKVVMTRAERDMIQSHSSQLEQIIQIDARIFGVVGNGIVDDTITLNKLFSYLGEYGGKVILNKKYLINNSLTLNIKNDVEIIIEGTLTSEIICQKANSFYNVIHAKTDDGTNKGTVICRGLKINAEQCGTGYNSETRMQGISFNNLKNVIAYNNEIKKLYGTGIFVSNCKNIMNVSYNKIIDVWGYNTTLDSYGDGIYISTNINNGIVCGNIIENNAELSDEVGRIGICLEFDTSNISVKRNKIKGYNRGIHIENTKGGHIIKNNDIQGCPCPFVWVGEKGYSETIFKNNTCSTKGFINKNKTLTFYTSMVLVGNGNEGKPKLKLLNNKIIQVNENNNPPRPLSINNDNVVLENNYILSDSLSNETNKSIYCGSRKNIIFNKNIFENISFVDISYSTIDFTNNIVQCDYILTDYSMLKFNNNTINPSNRTVGKVLGKRVNGEFLNNTINNFTNETIDNTRLWNNVSSIEASGNIFNRNTVESSITPCKADENIADTIFTLKKNIINDKVLTTTRKLYFIGGWREYDGINIIYSNTKPDYGTWNVGDKCINMNPQSGGYCGWIKTSNGWKGYGLIES